MLKQFYVTRNNKRVGPFSAVQLRRFAAVGQLRPTDTVWKEGMPSSVPARSIKGLFSGVKASGGVEAESEFEVVEEVDDVEVVEEEKPEKKDRKKEKKAEEESE